MMRYARAQSAKGLLALLVMATLSGAALAAAPVVPAEVTLHATAARWIFSDYKGMTLYTFDRDVTPGISACEKECASKWPPLMAPANVQSAGDWSAIKRSDGSLQWAYKNKPLYRFVRDAFPGSQFGERPENDLWHVAGQTIDAPADAKVVGTPRGFVLADFDGLTLYTLDSDRVARGLVKSGCMESCLADWRPLQAAWITGAAGGDWSIVLRDDRMKQWAYKGKPLYTYAGDNKIADLNGDGAAGINGTWRAIVLEPAPPFPSWVTFEPTDGGEVVTDPNGKTLYAFDAEQNVSRPSGGASERGCNQYCLDFYKPVLAAPSAKGVADWTIVTNVNGDKQWAHKGLLLFTYSKDVRPGEITGTKNYRVFFPIMRLGGAMQGTGGS